MVAFKSCFLLLVDDVHGLCREPRATHSSFDGNIFGSCGQYYFYVLFSTPMLILLGRFLQLSTYIK